MLSIIMNTIECHKADITMVDYNEGIDLIKEMVEECIGYDVREKDVYYEIEYTKAFQNISEWKYEAIEAMIVFWCLAFMK